MFCCGRPSWADEGDADGGELLTAPSMLELASALAAQRAASARGGDQLTADLLSSIASGAIHVTSSGPIPSLASATTGSGSTAGSAAAFGTSASASAVGAWSALSDFFAGLASTPSLTVSVPSAPDAAEDPEDAAAAAAAPAAAAHSLHAVNSLTAADGAPAAPHLEYKRYALKGYVELPSVMQPFLSLPVLDHMLIVGLPTMAPSVGLAGYRARVPKRARKDAPFLIVIDAPGKLAGGAAGGGFVDAKYIWVEFSLGDVFRLDVSGMAAMGDYVKTLSKKARWNFKDRQKKFNDGKAVAWEMAGVPEGPAGRAFLRDTLWPLYKQTGEKNGFTVLTEEEFYSFHEEVPGVEVMMVYDVRGTAQQGGEKDPAGRRLVSFCTGVRWRDVLMPMWCGTDYDNDLARTASTYFNMLYEYVRMGIADPAIRWVDLGASRRAAKTAIGFSPYPSSGYFRCTNVVMQALVEEMMGRYYNPERLINDP